MPLYEYECTECGHVSELVFRIDDFPDAVDCTQCNKKAVKVISKIQDVRPTLEYFDINLTEGPGAAHITGRRQRRELMKRMGLEEKHVPSSKIRERKERNAELKFQKEKANAYRRKHRPTGTG